MVLTLKGNPVYNHTDEATICQGETYAFGTKNLTEAGVYTEVFTAASGCDFTVVLTLNVNQVYNISTTTTVYSDNLPFSFGNQSLTEEGIYSQSLKTFQSVDN